MNLDVLAGKVLVGRIDGAIERACRFFAEYRCLDDLTAAQMQQLREKPTKYQTWPELWDELEKFLTHKSARDEARGLTGWEKVGPALLESLRSLPQETGLNDSLKEEAKRILDRLAEAAGNKGFSSEEAELRIYFLEAGTDDGKKMLAQHHEQLHYIIASAFIGALCLLCRSKEVLADPEAAGRVYCQRMCP